MFKKDSFSLFCLAFFVLVILPCLGVGCLITKVSCEQTQKYSNNPNVTYEYHFPAGCIEVHK